MGTLALDSILVSPLQRISVKGGDVLRALKVEDVGFQGFGEAYFSWIDKNEIKGWKRHSQMTMNLVVPVGMVRFVFADSVSDTHSIEFRTIEIGSDNYARITVPPNIWFAFQGLEQRSNLILNISNILHSSTESEKLDLRSFEYSWNNS
ncbi:hypothetical protein MCEMRE203_00047 [Candidatus Nanopelagicaceae bacterium]